jgi:hypothetical protein
VHWQRALALAQTQGSVCTLLLRARSSSGVFGYDDFTETARVYFGCAAGLRSPCAVGASIIEVRPAQSACICYCGGRVRKTNTGRGPCPRTRWIHFPQDHCFLPTRISETFLGGKFEAVGNAPGVPSFFPLRVRPDEVGDGVFEHVGHQAAKGSEVNSPAKPRIGRRWAYYVLDLGSQRRPLCKISRLDFSYGMVVKLKSCDAPPLSEKSEKSSENWSYENSGIT